MTGKQIVEALQEGKQVNIIDSRGRMMTATSCTDDGEGYWSLSGFNQYNDDRYREIVEREEYKATAYRIEDIAYKIDE